MVRFFLKNLSRDIVVMFDFVCESLYRALLFSSFCVLGVLIWLYWKVFVLLAFAFLCVRVVCYYESSGG